MRHTREALTRNRGLMVIILALMVAYALEPSLGRVGDLCHEAFRFLIERGAAQ